MVVKLSVQFFIRGYIVKKQIMITALLLMSLRAVSMDTKPYASQELTESVLNQNPSIVNENELQQKFGLDSQMLTTSMVKEKNNPFAAHREKFGISRYFVDALLKQYQHQVMLTIWVCCKRYSSSQKKYVDYCGKKNIDLTNQATVKDLKNEISDLPVGIPVIDQRWTRDGQDCLQTNEDNKRIIEIQKVNAGFMPLEQRPLFYVYHKNLFGE